MRVLLSCLRLVEQFSRALLIVIGVNTMCVTALICIAVLMRPGSIIRFLVQ